MTTTMRPTADQREVLPTILNTDDTDYEVALGEDVTLKCETTGNPQPTIVWYKDRKPIYVDGSRYKMSGSGDLTIRQVKSADSAEYICRAFNNAGSDYLYTDLVVKSRVNILAEDTDIEVELGGTAVLTCEADGTPPPRTTWEFQGFPVSGQRAGDSSLYLYNIRQEDIGDYTCTADNGISTDRKTVTLTLREPMEASLANHNKTYTSGDDMTLTCDTTSDAEITWSKDGRVISSTSNIFISGSSLTVTDLLESDTGYYTCRADDGTDVITVGTSILVEAPVTKSPVPASCGDRPDLANCALIVRYNYCGHPVYKHFCCKSCLEAGKFNSSNRPFRH